MASAGLKELNGQWFNISNNIIELNMQNNSLTILKRADLRTLPKLENLDLSHNRISHLGRDCFAELTNIKTINLESNMLKEVIIEIFNLTLDKFC